MLEEMEVDAAAQPAVLGRKRVRGFIEPCPPAQDPGAAMRVLCKQLSNARPGVCLDTDACPNTGVNSRSPPLPTEIFRRSSDLAVV